MCQIPRALLFWAVIVAAGLGASFVTRAQAPSAAPSPDILPSLLAEVRGLRAAMEQLASAGPRVQLALGRLQLQEQRIQNLVRRLEIVRGNLSAPQRRYDELADRIKYMTEQLPSRNEEERRMNLLEIRGAKEEVGRLSGELQKLFNEEIFINQEIANEQARWTDFNQRLEELERSLIKR